MSDTIQPFVTVPHSAGTADVRWSIMRMLAHIDREARVRAAERVLRSLNPCVTDDHRAAAAGMVAGTWDPIGAKLRYFEQITCGVIKRPRLGTALFVCTLAPHADEVHMDERQHRYSWEATPGWMA